MTPLRFPAFLAFFILLPAAFGQQQQHGGLGANAVPPETEPGIPVTDKLTIERCSSCHKSDEKGNLTRISWIRTTPEGWEEATKRMIRNNGATLDAADARHIVSYLSRDHGLAPEETLANRWYLEKRQVESEPIPSPEIRMACASCHTFARPQTWRRSATEWKLLENMHIGYFPVAENNSFHAHARPDGSGILRANLSAAAPLPKDPVDQALEYLDKNYNLHSAAWSSWHAASEDPKLAGRWAVSATSAGKGRYYGFMTITPGASPDVFKTETTLTRVADGTKTSFNGKAVIYTGYEWRGRSDAGALGEVREVMMVSPDKSKIEGRWFWGGYQEFGFNVTAHRSSSDLTVLGTDVSSAQAGSQGVAIRLIGQNFPRGLAAGDIDLGSGVHVSKVVSVKPGEVALTANVDANAISGFRRVSVKGGTAPDAFAVYDRIDYIKIANDSAMARLGGTTHPKGYVQYEAIAYNRGVDGVANTADDVDLGPVNVKWSMEEFIARYNDDDKEFVGSINNDGLFTPAGEGPNPQRRFTTNNTGDIWVVANYQGKGTSATPLKATSYLVVTVPVYMKWDQPEIAQ